MAPRNRLLTASQRDAIEDAIATLSDAQHQTEHETTIAMLQSVLNDHDEHYPLIMLPFALADDARVAMWSAACVESIKCAERGEPYPQAQWDRYEQLRELVHGPLNPTN